MSTPTASPDRVYRLDICLMLTACVIALFLPFQLFLFAYAILGPAHYLTEISWLHKRRYFTKGRYDYWLLGGLAAIATIAFPVLGASFSVLNGPGLTKITSAITFFAFGAALVLMLTEKTWHRVLGLAGVLALSLLTVNRYVILAWMIALFGTSLIHVYVFTGLFILYGALKARSRIGYVSFCLFLLCPLVCLLAQPRTWLPSQYVLTTYWEQFSLLNRVLLGVGNIKTQADFASAAHLVFKSPIGLAIMRFVAFAYTYHYLNWFSKTSIIKWHQVPGKRLALLGTLWLTCIALYLFDYGLGVKVLMCISLMHVYLEFPLNHISLIGIFRELAAVRQRGQLGASPSTGRLKPSQVQLTSASSRALDGLRVERAKATTAARR